MPTFRDNQVVRRGDYQEGEDLDSFLDHHDDDDDDDNDDEYEYEEEDDNDEDDNQNYNNDDENKNDDDPTVRYKRLYYSVRNQASSQFLLFCLGYLFLGTFVIVLVTWSGGWHSWTNAPLDVDEGMTNYQDRLKLSDIQHWCRKNNNTTIDDNNKKQQQQQQPSDRSRCKQCGNPLLPKHRRDKPGWSSTHQANVKAARQYSTTQSSSKSQSSSQQPHVVFLGDSITEGWMGKSFGQLRPYKQDNIAVFQDLFGVNNNSSNGSKFPGLALGIAGDTSPNLLWRIQHDEVPLSSSSSKRQLLLQPSVWWILIGTNDFLKDGTCSREVVTMGIQRVVEEMMEKVKSSSSSTDAKIVINSLLPRATDHPQGWLLEREEEKNDHNNGNASSSSSSNPLWYDLQQVNQALERYAAQQRNVLFFNATSIFVRAHDNSEKVIPQQQQQSSHWYIPTEYMADYLHPTALGYRQWGQAIVQALQQIQQTGTIISSNTPPPPPQ